MNDSLWQLVFVLTFITIKIKTSTIYVAYLTWLKILRALNTLSTKFQVRTFKCLLDTPYLEAPKTFKTQHVPKRTSHLPWKHIPLFWKLINGTFIHLVIKEPGSFNTSCSNNYLGTATMCQELCQEYYQQ